MRIIPILSLLFVALTSAAPAFAHEFWISPTRYQVEPGEPIEADLRVGQNFKGAAFAYIDDRIARFDLAQGDAVQPVQGRMGDRPALRMAAPGDGLVIIIHETTDSRLTYTDWDVFVSFVTHKGFAGALDDHARRGLPQTGFSETYRRFAKALVAVGNGAGQDRAFGLETEIVALANPYTDALGDGLPVQVLYRGEPRPAAQLEVFERAPDDSVGVSQLVTDDQGRVTVPVRPGQEYLLDAVVLRDTGTDDPAAGPVWHSLWAALTFRVPD